MPQAPTPSRTTWGTGGLAEPAPGTAYSQILRGDSYAWWRSALGVLLALALWLLLGGATGGLILSAAHSLGHADMPQADFLAAAQRYEFWEGMLSSHVQLALGIPVALLMVWQWHQVRPGYVMSVEGRFRRRFLLLSLALAVVVFAIYIATVPLRGGVLSWTPQPGFMAFLVVILLVTPLQAAAEEFLFRGYLLQALGSLVAQPWFGVIASALLFALFHGTQNVPLFLSRFAFGLVVGWLVVRTGGLEAAIAAHVVNNVFAFVLAGVTSTISAARTLTAVGWLQTFSDVGVYLLFSLLAAALAWRLGLLRRVPERDRQAARKA